MAQTEKQEQARIRNWNKARLTGFCLNKNTLTTDEVDLYIKMIRLQNELLKKWDTNTAAITGREIPPYKCWCGKRTKIERLSKRPAYRGGPQYLCKTHWEEEQDTGTDV